MSSPTPPGTPKTGSRWASRMGAAVRRSSTLLSIARPTTPSSQVDRDSDSTSLRKSISREALPASMPKLSTTTSTPPLESSMPTPIAESPAREAEATQREAAVGPSPLAKTASSTAAEMVTTTGAANAAETAPAQATSPVGYVPPPLIDSTAGNPGAFTDVLETIPQPDVVRDPYAATNTGPPPPEEVAPSSEPQAPVAEVTATEPPPVVEEAPTIEYVPPTVVDSTAGNHGAFKGGFDGLPQSSTIRDPYANPAPAAALAAEEPVAKVVEEPAPAPELVPEPQQQPEPQPEPEVEVAVERVDEAPAMEHNVSYFDDKPMAESILEYDSPTEEVIPVEFVKAIEINSPAPIAVAETTEAPTTTEERQFAAELEAQNQAQKQGQGEAATYYNDPPSSFPIPVHSTVPDSGTHTVDPPTANGNEDRDRDVAPPTFKSSVMPSYDLPEYMSPDIWGGAEHVSKPPHNVWASASEMPDPIRTVPGPAAEVVEQAEVEESGYHAMPIATPIAIRPGENIANGHELEEDSVSSSLGMPNPHPGAENDNEDPFADPVPPVIAVSHSEAPTMPHAEPSAPHPQALVPSHEEARGIVQMPLPAFQDVVPQHHIPSHSSLEGDNDRPEVETNERMPLLGQSTHKKNKLYAPAATPKNQSSVSPLASSSWNPHGVAHQPHLHELGWLEYHLPDGCTYYVHPTRRVTTDMNLRSESTLAAVEAWLEETNDETLDVGVEAWLREAKDGSSKATKKSASGKVKKGKKGEEVIQFERYWIDYHNRTVVKDTVEDRRITGYTRGHIRGQGGHGKGKQVGHCVKEPKEDELDLEFRFWSFIEAHPAHTALPHKARVEAMDVLTWAWTDRLLPSVRPIPAPFDKEECQELMTLLRSFHGEGHHDDHGIQTRVVARIMLRIAVWRQTYFRPNKPLPEDAGSSLNELPIQRRPFRRALFDFIISCLCLGIPYIFLERARISTRVDHESGFLRSNPLTIIGVCTCLVAAIVLSASVTFLALPGLDNVTRTSTMVAVVFATFSMVATAVAILRHKADLERPISHIGIEGLMAISRRTVALSLPMVFLAYALICFLAGVVIYTFRGVPSAPNNPQNTFAEYTRWIIVGVVGALAGVVTVSLLLFRR